MELAHGTEASAAYGGAGSAERCARAAAHNCGETAVQNLLARNKKNSAQEGMSAVLTRRMSIFTGKPINPKDRASVQIMLAKLNEEGRATGEVDILNISGDIRTTGEVDSLLYDYTEAKE